MLIRNYIPENDLHKEAEHFFVFGNERTNYRKNIKQAVSDYILLQNYYPEKALFYVMIDALTEMYSIIRYLDQKLQLDNDYKKDY